MITLNPDVPRIGIEEFRRWLGSAECARQSQQLKARWAAEAKERQRQYADQFEIYETETGFRIRKPQVAK